MPEKSISMCQGCRDDFYNGKNPYGIKQCWSFASATVEPRIVIGVWQRPPYNKKSARPCLSCFKPEGQVAVKPEALDEKGYWKT